MIHVAHLPRSQTALARVRANYFGSWGSSLLTLLAGGFPLWLGLQVLDWTVLNATFRADATQEQCVQISGACWSVIAARWRVILFGIYPYDEQWRSGVACLIVMGVVFLSCLPRVWSFGKLAATWGIGAASFYILMKGGLFGLTEVNEQNWGGLALTLFIFAATCVFGMPLAIALTLMRRHELPVIAKVTGWLIVTVRSLPLLSLLFTFAIVLPFMLSDWAVGPKIYRVIAAEAHFFAAYQAEIIRGGFQGVPEGQEESARALGLTYGQRMVRILLPQAFRLALPTTINQVVITFTETSLVVVVGFVGLLAAGDTAFQTGEWKFAYVEATMNQGRKE